MLLEKQLKYYWITDALPSSDCWRHPQLQQQGNPIPTKQSTSFLQNMF